eukprot:scaffold71019_cov55-Phaeocystis_antarctica.AAC.4
MAAIAMAALAVLAEPLRSACHGSTHDQLTMALLTMALLTLALTPTLTSCWPRRCVRPRSRPLLPSCRTEA